MLLEIELIFDIFVISLFLIVSSIHLFASIRKKIERKKAAKREAEYAHIIG